MKDIIKSIGNFFAFGTKVVDPQQYNIKRMKRMAYRVEAAMEYIHADECVGKYSGYDEGKIKKYKLHWRKRVFDVR